MAVFAPGMTRPKLPCDNVAPAGEPPQRLLHLPQRKPPTRRRVGAEEGDVGPRPADQEGRQRLVDFFEERIGEADRQRDAERVAITRDILGGDPPLLVGDAYSDRTALALQLIEPFGTDSSSPRFGSGQIGEARSVSTTTVRTSRARIAPISSRRPSMSKTSLRHSR